MIETDAGFANRCLPLRIANQFGWFILNDQTIEVVWSGGSAKAALTINFPANRKSESVTSHFGHGILTWHIPFLFRTPPGYNLMVRGPTNWPKDGAVALDGIVETDWAVATFTMNWKLTFIDTPVLFRENEPICMIAPVARGQLERFSPEIRPLHENEDLSRRFQMWSRSRDAFLGALNDGVAPRNMWQKHYYCGTSPADDKPDEHQTRLRLLPFVDKSTENMSEAAIPLRVIEDPMRVRRRAKSLWSTIYQRFATRRS